MAVRRISGQLPRFDLVVIGAGGGGSAAAATFARAHPDAKVALLETGDDWRGNALVDAVGLAPLSRALRGTGPMRGLRHTYQTEPEEFLKFRQLTITRGRGLGGDSLVDNAAYLRGTPADYAGWSRSPAWTVDAIMQDFASMRKSRRMHVEPPSANAIASPLNNCFVSGCEGMGLMPVETLNVENDHPQAGVTQLLSRRGRRMTAFAAHCAERPDLDDADLQKAPENLSVFVGAHAAKLVLDTSAGDARVTGVHVHGWVVECGQVIVSCGTIETPLLLQRSGVGPAIALEAAGIPTVVANEYIGAGVSSQPSVAYVFGTDIARVPSKSPSLYLARYLREQWQDWSESGKGVLASASELAALVKSERAVPHPDTRIDFYCHRIRGTPDNQGAIAPYCGYSATSTLVRGGSSCGTVSVRSADPRKEPRVVLNVGHEPSERRAMDEGMAWAQLLLHPQSGLRSTYQTEERSSGEVHPFDRMNVFCIQPKSLTMDKHWRAPYVTEHVSVDGGLLAGSCALGAALQDDLRVPGISNLRVADSSVIPKRVHANLSVVAQMIGVKAAGFAAAAGGLS